jgi:hypothetical protein
VTLLTSPTSPAPVNAVQQPLSGAWRGSLHSRAARADSNTTVGFSLNCSQRWEISSQSGGHFEGKMSSEGSGADSDWRCVQSRSFDGDVTSDDRVAISFSPAFTPGGCTDVDGGQRVTGVRAGDSIVIDVPYHATCEMFPGGPSLQLAIAANITLSPW